MKLQALSLIIFSVAAGFPPTALSAWAQSTGGNAVDTSSARRELVRAGDIITLKVWREPDWSGDFAVNDQGIATFPRIGEVHVTGMTPDSLQRFLVDSLGQFLRNPSIEVIPQRRIRVLGAVQKPGLYPVPSTTTVGDALAIAGGATSDGKQDKVVLRRDGKQLSIDLTRDTRLSDTPIRTGDELYVPQRGWVSRNSGLVAAGLSAATTVLVALLLR